MSKLPTPLVSAVVDPGAITSRVKVIESKRHREANGRKARPAQWRRDPTRGRYVQADASPTVLVSISMTRNELRDLDAAAARAQMSRSHFLREAFKRLLVVVR